MRRRRRPSIQPRLALPPLALPSRQGSGMAAEQAGGKQMHAWSFFLYKGMHGGASNLGETWLWLQQRHGGVDIVATRQTRSNIVEAHLLATHEGH